MMKSEDVKIGGHYKAKVNDRITTIRIDAENANGGWDATNLITNKKIRIKSAQRLRGEANVPGGDTKAKGATADAVAGNTGEHGGTSGKRKKKTAKKPSPSAPPWAKQKQREALKAQHKADQENARLRDERKASPDGMTASERAMAETEKEKPEAKPKRKRTGPSLIEAAIQVLRENRGPMTCSQMIEQIFEKNLWSTTGKTPAATLYSAILREIQKKGDEARFVHVERGKFDLTDAGKKER